MNIVQILDLPVAQIIDHCLVRWILAMFSRDEDIVKKATSFPLLAHQCKQKGKRSLGNEVDEEGIDWIYSRLDDYSLHILPKQKGTIRTYNSRECSR